LSYWFEFLYRLIPEPKTSKRNEMTSSFGENKTHHWSRDRRFQRVKEEGGLGEENSLGRRKGKMDVG
jgi:hypothetical protein